MNNGTSTDTQRHQMNRFFAWKHLPRIIFTFDNLTRRYIFPFHHNVSLGLLYPIAMSTNLIVSYIINNTPLFHSFINAFNSCHIITFICHHDTTYLPIYTQFTNYIIITQGIDDHLGIQWIIPFFSFTSTGTIYCLLYIFNQYLKCQLFHTNHLVLLLVRPISAVSFFSPSLILTLSLSLSLSPSLISCHMNIISKILHFPLSFKTYCILLLVCLIPQIPFDWLISQPLLYILFYWTKLM